MKAIPAAKMLHVKRTANLRSTGLEAVRHMASHFDKHEAHLVAILATSNESNGFNVFAVELASWDKSNSRGIRDHAKGLLSTRLQDEHSNLGIDLQEITGGHADPSKTALLGVSLVDRLQSRDAALLDRATQKPEIQGYMTVTVFVDQSAASSITPESGAPMTISSAPLEQRYLEANLLDVSSSNKDFSAYEKTEAEPLLDLLCLATVMTADQSDLNML